jgi:predicted ATPase/class 3 adenylate cyclase
MIDLPTGTVTFLFTDIEGSTRLLRELGPQVYSEALATHRSVLRRAFAAAGGVEIDTQGDAFFVAFPTAAGAVAAARSGQLGLAPGPITVRMGLHTGAPIVAAEGYVGIDVHRGARVAAVAHGGQVILSAATAALLEDESLLDLGHHRLKDFDVPAQLFQLGAGEFPPLRTPGAVDLPQPANHFLGRERELLEAVTLWVDRVPRVLTIVGPGGTGKTRFSIELARRLAEEADGGTVFVPLAAVRDSALIVSRIADRLGAPSADPAAVAAHLGAKQTHVLLDNLEQLLPDAARPLAELIAAAPGLRIVATSREPLRIAGELEFDLPPMEQSEALTLFIERAQAVRADVGDSEATRELIRRLDGLPLAIELAAARAKVLGPAELLERIAQRLDLLKGGRDVDERHATLRATISWSYDLLAQNEQVLFANLAVFPGGYSLSDAERVCDADVETLESLLDKSLVRRRTDPDGAQRFWMLETIREFAAERLESSGSLGQVRRRHAEHVLARAETLGLSADASGTGVEEQYEVAQFEQDNMRAALDWAVEGDPELGLRLALALLKFWLAVDPSEGADWIGAFLERADGAPAELRAMALRDLGGCIQMTGRPNEAEAHYRASLDLYESIGEPIGALRLRYRLAIVSFMCGELERARELAEDALGEALALGARFEESRILGTLSRIEFKEGNVASAYELELRSLEISRELGGWKWGDAIALIDLADLACRLHRPGAAEAHALDALALSRETGDRSRTAFALACLALVARIREDDLRAGTLWGSIEAEESRARLDGWLAARPGFGKRIEKPGDPTFESGRQRGLGFSTEEAIAFANGGALDG